MGMVGTARVSHTARMARLTEQLLDYIKRFPGRDDDEIAAALKISPRQTVNTYCRKLCEQGLLRRERGPRGKIVNIPVTSTSSTSMSAKTPKPLPKPRPSPPSGEALTEDQVKAAVAMMLTTQGWSPDIKWGKARGIDIVATRGSERWVIECKGTGSLAPMQNNYFVGVIGELVQRMGDPDAKHSVALPDMPKFRRLWSELSPLVKQRLGVTALFVAADGTVNELA